ncbi:MAG: Zn-dependent hydrolase [Pseudomonadota bacterium]
MEIDLGQLRADMDAINAFGCVEGLPGINRVSFSDADMAGRRWFMGRCEEAGLETRMDAVGNVLARWNVGSGPAVLAGSHLDSVPNGGAYDGTLGCCAALEAVRTLMDAGFRPASPIEVVAFAEEEGRFGGMLGSQALCGLVDPDWYAAATDETGLPLHEAMSRQGLDPAALASAARPAAEIKAFVELHIEQGPILELAQSNIGVATTISGVFNWTIEFEGVANHSGTTPMHLRQDAFAGLASFAEALPTIIADIGTDQTRLTIGKVALAPNFPHTIPGSATFSLIGRDTNELIMRRVADRCRSELETAARSNGLEFAIQEESRLAPMPLDLDLAQTIDQLAGQRGYASQKMPCGAGHDAQSMAAMTRAGLIFVPSKGGISHAPEEFTTWEDCAKGANVLLDAIRALSS